VSRTSIAGTVFDAERAAGSRWGWLALVAVAVHVAPLALAPRSDTLEPWALGTAGHVRALLGARAPRSVSAAPTATPSPVPEPPSSSPPARALPRVSGRALSPVLAARTAGVRTGAAPSPAPALAQAGSIVAATREPAPLDFTDAFVVGTAQVYAGGVSSRLGDSAHAVSATRAGAATRGEGALVPGGGGGSGRGGVAQPERRQALALTDPDWACPWPEGAAADAVEHAEVLLEVRADAAGRVREAKVVEEPGFGFGAQALGCAREAELSPALDEHGRAVEGRAKLRVRFVR
jgi:Gram-negative bacterial TonB protein C-terminal